jgi:hypothetical protein
VSTEALVFLLVVAVAATAASSSGRGGEGVQWDVGGPPIAASAADLERNDGGEEAVDGDSPYPNMCCSEEILVPFLNRPVCWC